MTKHKPEIMEVNTQQLEELLDRARTNTLREEDTKLMGAIFESYTGFFALMRDKNATLARLRKLLFGSSSEKAEDILPDNSDDASEDILPEEPSAPADHDTPDESPPGHGRHSADDYAGANQIDVPHETLTAGDACPECDTGTLYEQTPSVLVRIVGQAPLDASVIRLQRLRCHTCGKIYTATTPPDVNDEKYDHTAASMIGLLKYGSGLPFNRLQRLQANCEIPLAASTQWDIVHAASPLLTPAYDELIRQAAQGDVVHNDDTTVRILELMGERDKERADDEDDPSRKGLYTSGVVATRGGIHIALFFSGRQHAGENLADILQHRADELNTPIQMCDGLTRNLPREFKTILANCLAHGRRNFVDIIDSFPQQCQYVIEAFKIVYSNDKVAREEGMSAEERLAHHQAHSKPTMDDLHAWLTRQISEHLVEPNSSLGEAISYLLKRWEPLTLFLRKTGAPLDNNICERALKKAILHRKNALFYKTANGARVGDMYMSMIYSCELNHVNAFEYLNELQLHADEVSTNPELWMPWNYQEHLACSTDAA